MSFAVTRIGRVVRFFNAFDVTAKSKPIVIKRGVLDISDSISPTTLGFGSSP